MLCRKLDAQATASSSLLGFVAAGAVLLVAASSVAFLATHRKATVQTVSNALPAPAPVESPAITAEVTPSEPAPAFTATQPPPKAKEESPPVEALKPAAATAEPQAVAPPLPQPPSQADVDAALHSTPIVMYGTSWCGACARARAFLDANRLQHVEHDIDTDEQARADLKRISGKLSIPVLLIDSVMVGPGFSEAGIKRALVASVEKRLGVRGIEARATRTF